MTWYLGASMEKKPGRPPLPEGEARTVRVSALVTREEARAIERAAKEQTVSTWIREVVVNAAQKGKR